MARYINIRQNTDNECGAAVLASICRYYRLKIPISRVRELADTDRHGTNLFGLKTAAEQLGFIVSALQADYEDIPEIPLPMIAHIVNDKGFGHFVIVYKFHKKYVVVADPAGEVTRWAREKFEKQWSGALLSLVPTDALSVVNERTLGLKDFLGITLRYWNILGEALVAAALATILTMSTAFFIQYIIDHVLVTQNASMLALLAAGMFLVLVFRALFGLFRSFLLLHLGQKIDVLLQAKYYRHVVDLPIRFFATRQTGEIISRMFDARAISELLTGTFMTLLLDVFMVALVLAAMFVYNITLGLVCLGLFALMAIIIMMSHPVIRRFHRKSMELWAELQSGLVDTIYGIDAIKAFGNEEHTALKTEKNLVKVLKLRFKMGLFSNVLQNANVVIAGVASIVVIWWGSEMVMDSVLTVGQLMSFYTLLGFLLTPIQGIANANIQIQEAAIAAERVGEIMVLEREVDKEHGKIEDMDVQGHFELRHVNFSYNNRTQTLFDVSIDIPAGATVALVGESGSGKTTICRLLARFYEVEEGEILLDGKNIKDIHVKELRRHLGWVDQECILFAGTIEDNIELGKESHDLEPIIEAASQAGIDEYIRQLPEAYKTRIGERGTTMSGGQKQRMAIARALLKRPRILLLDEATSHLDSKAEADIQRAIYDKDYKRTTLVVAHRLSTIIDADKIVVMHQGRVVEEGTHKELLDKKGAYHELWMRQAGEVVRPSGGDRG